ncbi:MULTISPECIES: universal stress protein [Oxalobacteraceae]|uniref:universal stress protein n=1 Tax=Oxalobacteraceae TaxID=75682 RepID=UPI0010A2DA5D|nr:MULTISPECIES: universal stress protein [Oxalobacteraceae]HJV50253.1 universal stress protein [Noviherbaspirillum sp.]
MPYKTILVHVDGSSHLDARVNIAASLAIAEGAHLVGAAVTGVSKIAYESMAFGQVDPYVDKYLKIAQDRANHALDRFESLASAAGVASRERRLVDDEPLGGISVQGRYSDLAVIGQIDPDEPSPMLYGNFPEYVAMNCGCPVLMIPYATELKQTGDNVLIAWNASAESTRAVHSAIPLLRRAKIVHVAVLNPSELPDAHGEQPGADIGLFLARHDIKVEITQQRTEIDVGEALLSLAADLGSDMLVMGCYGHSRFREILLGGVTRTMLQSMTIPVFMSH